MQDVHKFIKYKRKDVLVKTWKFNESQLSYKKGNLVCDKKYNKIDKLRKLKFPGNKLTS